MYIYFSETLLYICFALATSTVLLHFIPTDRRPAIRLSSTALFNLIMAITALSFVPVARATLYFTDEQLTFWIVLQDVLADLEFGQAWLAILFQCTLILFVMAFRDISKHLLLNGVVAALLLGVIIAYGWASHAAGQSESFGFIAESLHLLVISVWLGTIMLAAWFSKGPVNLAAFTRWFSPLSIVCVVVVIVSGLTMMFYIVPDLVSAWGISYGQSLLIKHLLFIPLLLFGLINGFLMRRKLRQNPDFDFRSWLRVESLFGLLIFIVTAFMGFQPPPHETEGAAIPIDTTALFRLFHPDILEFQPLSLAWSFPAILFALLGVSAAVTMVATYRKNAPWVTGVIGLLIPVSGLLSIMFFIA
ncbi:copper resistance D family protein [Paenibacillus koleovorans]|uniref:copper resistance D family protein n=1 Tax=Paenibacillus koleovorans TaxID=121608 RepID=UPI0013E31AB7|nr:CopD family protein [Paenibacillus koleovorans]